MTPAANLATGTAGAVNTGSGEFASDFNDAGGT